MTDKTYSLKSSHDGVFIGGQISGQDALLVKVFLHLLTERGKYDIFDNDFGILRSDLYGERREYVTSVLKRRISEVIEKYYKDELSVSGYEVRFEGDGLFLTLSLSHKDEGGERKTYV